ncbi:Phenolic glucoside malonyltransferase 2 [Forsythia ovata]|uniref:Phenolic glucoside malonyltransferase 2 n=1 Tax=Forsythia ovata TaxID=205694 RepID=A0ABD1S8B0_9LAMI
MEIEGYFIAAEAIAEVIRTKVNNKEQRAKKLKGKRILSVAGSPKFDLYNADYGWGRPKLLEAVSIDGDNAISLCKSRESEGGLEVGLSLDKTKMDAFAAIFTNGLRVLTG